MVRKLVQIKAGRTQLMARFPAISRFLVLLLVLSGIAAGQRSTGPGAAGVERAGFTPERSRVENHLLASRLMDRKMPYRVVLNSSYDRKDRRFPVVYLLHGLSGHFDNWTERTKIEEYAASHDLIIVTPEGGDGWYTDSASVPNDKFESYLIKELIPEIDRKFRTAANRENRSIAGLSMGGYGAIKFGLKYPEMFAIIGSFSGAFDAPSRGLGGAKTWPSIVSVFGPDGSETRRRNDIFALVRAMPEAGRRSLPFIYLDCGTEDFLFKTNREFAALLVETKVPHEYRQRPGTHNWQYWDSQVREFLALADSRLENASK